MDERIKVAIGCPVAHREWILDRWFDHLEVACDEAHVEPTYVFVGDPNDEPTVKIIEKRAQNRVSVAVPNAKGADFRVWGQPGSFERMVNLRNRLLGAVRMIRPEYFLSLDSDILLHPYALRNLVDDARIDGWGAVGGKCYMTVTGRRHPSWGKLGREGQIMRSDAEGYFPVEIIMAIKLMTPDAYNVDYRYDPQGEDVGWCRACREAGVSLAWDGRVVSKHVLEPHLLDYLDPRVGF